MGPRLIYLADVRLPTEKAHGWQIVKMSEAFAGAGADVELRWPRRGQEDPRLAHASVYDYYGVARSFRVRELRGPDVVGLEPRLPVAVSLPLIQGYSALWEMGAALAARTTRPDLIYTRDLGVAVAAGALHAPAAYEVHKLFGPRGRRAIRWMARRPQPRIVALTPYIRDAFLQEGFEASRIIVEGDAVDPQHTGTSRRRPRRAGG